MKVPHNQALEALGRTPCDVLRSMHFFRVHAQPQLTLNFAQGVHSPFDFTSIFIRFNESQYNNKEWHALVTPTNSN